MAHSAILRRESRGAHQRLDEGCTERDDVNYLKHSLAHFNEDAPPSIDYSDVIITKSQPKARLYGEAAEKAAAQEAQEALVEKEKTEKAANEAQEQK